MRRSLAVLLGVLLSSCGAKKIRYKKAVAQNGTQQEQVQPSPKTAPKAPRVPLTKNEQAKQYIERFTAVAQQEMKTYKIPASITLAQGLLESGFGAGRLAVEGNNHFGIKCHKEWNGQRIYHDDDRKGECFRVYDDAAASFRDHSLFLTERSRYAALFKLKPTNYKAWAKGLKKAGYATDPKYPDKLISLIERFGLDRYDNLKQGRKEKRAIKKVATHNVAQRHRVQKGDTLYSISKQYNVSVAILREVNQLEASTIYLGQEIIIPKN